MPTAPFLHRHRLRGWGRWLTLCLVWALLAPGLTVALAQARGDYSLFQEVCRATGSSRSDDATGGVLEVLTQGHCPACQLHWQDLAPPPVLAGSELPLRADLAHALPERFWRAPVTAHAWRPASARAPPQSI